MLHRCGARARGGLPPVAFQRGPQLVGELGLEPAQEGVERAVGPVVQQAAESQARDVREAAREHLGPDLDRGALGLAERLEILLEQSLDAFLRRVPIALLQRAEQRAVVALREAVLQLVERVGRLCSRAGAASTSRAARLCSRVPHDLVHADARDRELRAGRGIDVAGHRHVDDQRRLRRSACARRAARALPDSEIGVARRRSRSAAPRRPAARARNASSEMVLRAEARRERRRLVDAAVDDREVEAGLRERHGRALRHRRHADERDAARRARDPRAQMLHGDLARARRGPSPSFVLAAHAARDPERLLEHQTPSSGRRGRARARAPAQ